MYTRLFVLKVIVVRANDNASPGNASPRGASTLRDHRRNYVFRVIESCVAKSATKVPHVWCLGVAKKYRVGTSGTYNVDTKRSGTYGRLSRPMGDNSDPTGLTGNTMRKGLLELIPKSHNPNFSGVVIW